MTTGIVMKWTTGVVIALSLFTAGCGEKKSDIESLQSQGGVAPASPPEKSGSDDTLPRSGGSERSPSGVKQEQNPEGGRKS